MPKGRLPMPLLELDKKLLAAAKEEYLNLYNKNCMRAGVCKYWLLSLQMRTLLMVLSIEKMIAEEIHIKDFYRTAGYSDNAYFRKHIRDTYVPEFGLESILAVCEFVNISILELKKRVLSDLMIQNGEQNQKIYEKLNKQFSRN